MHKPDVTAPIVGATRISHIDDAAAATSLELALDEMEALDAAYADRDERHAI